MKLRVTNISTYLGNDEYHAAYQNDEQDDCPYDDFDNWDLLSSKEQAARRDPDQYTLMIDKYKEKKVWKAVARFEQRPLTDVYVEGDIDVDVASCIRWNAGKAAWEVAVEHKGHAIGFGHHRSHDDALAFAIEAIRCLLPNAMLSDAKRSHQPETTTIQAIAQNVASIIARQFDKERMPPRVKAVMLLNFLHFSGGQFERNRDGVWQLWQEEDHDINPELVSNATDIQHEVAEVLDTVWSNFHSYKIDPDRYALNVPQRV